MNLKLRSKFINNNNFDSYNFGLSYNPNYKINLEIQQKIYETMKTEIDTTDKITKFPTGYNNFYDYKNDLIQNIKSRYLKELK